MMQSLIKIHERKKNQSEADSYTKGKKDRLKLAGRDAKPEFRTVSNRRQKAAPGQVLAEHCVLLGKNHTRRSARTKAVKGR